MVLVVEASCAYWVMVVKRVFHSRQLVLMERRYELGWGYYGHPFQGFNYVALLNTSTI